VSWVVDERVKRLRDSAERQLRQAGDHVGDADWREHAVQEHATALVAGHALGDQIITDIIQAVAGCGRARVSINTAISQVQQIDIMKWVDDG